MTQQHLRYGASDDDGTGDKLRATFEKAESNFSELYAQIARIMANADPDLDTFAEVRAVITGFYTAVNGIPTPAQIQASINTATAAATATIMAAIAAGPVVSVNGKTGIAVLTAADVGAVAAADLAATGTSLRAYALALSGA